MHSCRNGLALQRQAGTAHLWPFQPGPSLEGGRVGLQGQPGRSEQESSEFNDGRLAYKEKRPDCPEFTDLVDLVCNVAARVHQSTSLPPTAPIVTRRQTRPPYY